MSTTKKISSRSREVPMMIAQREPFRTYGALRADAVLAGRHYGAGQLLGPERESFFAETDITYVVYSYATPIAWWSMSRGWYIVRQKFSMTTSHHQGRLYLIPTWDDESIPYSLDDCKHWGTPGPDCSGPRVGKVVRDGVILCEGHYNAQP